MLVEGGIGNALKNQFLKIFKNAAKTKNFDTCSVFIEYCFQVSKYS